MFMMCLVIRVFGSGGYYLHCTDEENEAWRDQNLGLRPWLSNPIAFTLCDIVLQYFREVQR